MHLLSELNTQEYIRICAKPLQLYLIDVYCDIQNI